MSQATRGRAPDAGFVLVGVIIFVLALTIIGISLFSLSSYEAGFLQRSLEDEQAFQSAIGALERAKFVLALEDAHFRDVKVNAPSGTSAVAWQVVSGEIDSMNGTVDWDGGNRVFIRVTAGNGSSQRRIEAWFDPVTTQNYYRQLITTGGGIEVREDGIPSGSNRARTVELNGRVWETSGQDTTLWKQWLRDPPGVSVQTSPDVPLPDVYEFIELHRNAATAPETTHTGVANDPLHPFARIYRIAGGASQPRYVTSDDAGNQTWSLSEGDVVKENYIHVSGCAVWLIPRGVWFYQPVYITGDSMTACLVIVAGRKGPPTIPEFQQYGTDSVGIWFSGGLQSAIPVILVSDGKVILWHYNSPYGANADSRVDDLSIFAESVSLMGPEVFAVSGYNNYVRLSHPRNGQLDDHFVPLLRQHNALPNCGSSLEHTLDLVSGTWRASTP